MASPSVSPWPAEGEDVVAAPNVRWEVVKTEQEEYLDKLQSKLSRIQESMVPPAHVESTNLDPDDISYDDMPNARILRDDDPGLHLLYDFPDVDRGLPSPTASAKSEPAPKSTTRPRLVRFRSRVRIASGVHKTASASSSTAGSVSSSISAPLRGMRREADSGTTSLGSMLSPGDASAWLRKLGRARQSTHDRWRVAQNERSPLISANGAPALAYTNPHSQAEENDADAVYDRIQVAVHKSEEEVMFGGWPWRLINRHWWWWKLEPILCCCAPLCDD